jgi:hypothetical protein
MVHLAGRQANCPSCGAQVELKLGSSAAFVCPYCRCSAVRRDRDLALYGKVADLVPTAPILAVGDGVVVDGVELVVGGRLQLDHGRGPWDEFYVESPADGRWGWLAKAQGRFYLTFATEASGLPPYEHMPPGAQGTLPEAGDAPWTVAERGESTLLSAEGELPFAVRSGEIGRYVDLSGPGGRFASLDYGDGLSLPILYVGREIDADRVELRPGLGPRPEETVKAGKLACPTCGGPVPIVAPQACERAICAHCHAVLDYRAGALAAVGKLTQTLSPLIPLGTEGKLFGEPVVVIGYMERVASDDGGIYRWSEYLLHSPKGYRWLTEDGGHFAYLRPIAAADVTESHRAARFEGRRYRAFQMAKGRVDAVVGEFYWRVAQGEAADLTDFVAPPHLLSREESGSEIVWSAGQYVAPGEVWRGLRLPGSAPKPVGVAPAQPNPHALGKMGLMTVAMVLGLCALSGALTATEDTSLLVDGPIQMPLAPGEPLDPAAVVVRTPPFSIARGPVPLRIDLGTTSDNQWVGVSCALVDQVSGEAREFFVEAGYYHGFSGGESWSEGNVASVEYLSAVPAGTYVLELLPSWQPFPQPGAVLPHGAPAAAVRLTSGERSPLCCTFSLLLLLAPAIVVLVRRLAFEGRRNQNSSFT